MAKGTAFHGASVGACGDLVTASIDGPFRSQEHTTVNYSPLQYDYHP